MASSLDAPCRLLWERRDLPVVTLVTDRALRPVLALSPEEVQRAFTPLLDAMIGWWPARERDLRELVETLLPACREVTAALPAAKRKQAEVLLEATLGSLRALDRHAAKSSLDAEIQKIDVDAWLAAMEKVPKVEKTTSTTQLARRLAAVAQTKGKWPELVAFVDRIGWNTTRAGMGSLSPRLKSVAESIDAGGLWEKTQVGASPALRVTHVDGSKSVVVLTPEDRAALVEVLPVLASALAG
jgi:hypothetical protein